MAISLEKSKSEARIFAIALVVLAIATEAIPSRWITALLMIPLAITAWLALFHGTTVISFQLQGFRRTAFQVAVAIAVPIALSFYFIHRTPELTASGVFGPALTPWFLLPVAIIGYASWHGAAQLDSEHPFRGFLVASTVLFVICLFGYYGIYSEFDEQTETSIQYIDKEAAALAAQSGRYFGQFLIYVAISYIAMLTKLKLNQSRPVI
jgi:hypothetical protein